MIPQDRMAKYMPWSARVLDRRNHDDLTPGVQGVESGETEKKFRRLPAGGKFACAEFLDVRIEDGGWRIADRG